MLSCIPDTWRNVTISCQGNESCMRSLQENQLSLYVIYKEPGQLRIHASIQTLFHVDYYILSGQTLLWYMYSEYPFHDPSSRLLCFTSCIQSDGFVRERLILNKCRTSICSHCCFCFQLQNNSVNKKGYNQMSIYVEPPADTERSVTKHLPIIKKTAHFTYRRVLEYCLRQA